MSSGRGGGLTFRPQKHLCYSIPFQTCADMGVGGMRKENQKGERREWHSIIFKTFFVSIPFFYNFAENIADLCINPVI